MSGSTFNRSGGNLRNQDFYGTLHRHPELEVNHDLKRHPNGKHHFIVDEDDWLEAREALQIIRDIMNKNGDLPILLGLSPILDKKIHMALIRREEEGTA